MTLHDTNLPKNTWDKFQDIKGQIETQGTDHEKLANIIAKYREDISEVLNLNEAEWSDDEADLLNLVNKLEAEKKPILRTNLWKDGPCHTNFTDNTDVIAFWENVISLWINDTPPHAPADPLASTTDTDALKSDIEEAINNIQFLHDDWKWDQQTWQLFGWKTANIAKIGKTLKEQKIKELLDVTRATGVKKKFEQFVNSVTSTWWNPFHIQHTKLSDLDEKQTSIRIAWYLYLVWQIINKGYLTQDLHDKIRKTLDEQIVPYEIPNIKWLHNTKVELEDLKPEYETLRDLNAHTTTEVSLWTKNLSTTIQTFQEGLTSKYENWVAIWLEEYKLWENPTDWPKGAPKETKIQDAWWANYTALFVDTMWNTGDLFATLGNTKSIDFYVETWGVKVKIGKITLSNLPWNAKIKIDIDDETTINQAFTAAWVAIPTWPLNIELPLKWIKSLTSKRKVSVTKLVKFALGSWGWGGWWWGWIWATVDVQASISNVTEVSREEAERVAEEQLRERYEDLPWYSPDRINLFLRRDYIKEKYVRKIMDGEKWLSRKDRDTEATDRQQIQKSQDTIFDNEIKIEDLKTKCPNTYLEIDKLCKNFMWTPPTYLSTMTDENFQIWFKDIVDHNPPYDNPSILKLIWKEKALTYSSNILFRMKMFVAHQKMVNNISNYITATPPHSDDEIETYCRTEIKAFMDTYNDLPKFLKDVWLTLDDPNFVTTLKWSTGTLTNIAAQTMKLKMQIIKKWSAAYKIKQKRWAWATIWDWIDSGIFKKPKREMPLWLLETCWRTRWIVRTWSIIAAGTLWWIRFWPLWTAVATGGVVWLRTLFSKYSHYTKEHEWQMKNEAVDLSNYEAERSRLQAAVWGMSRHEKAWLWWNGKKDARHRNRYVVTTHWMSEHIETLANNISALANKETKLDATETKQLEDFVSEWFARLIYYKETWQNFLWSDDVNKAEEDYRNLYAKLISWAKRLWWVDATNPNKIDKSAITSCANYTTTMNSLKAWYKTARKKFKSKRWRLWHWNALVTWAVAWWLSYLSTKWWWKIVWRKDEHNFNIPWHENSALPMTDTEHASSLHRSLHDKFHDEMVLRPGASGYELYVSPEIDAIPTWPASSHNFASLSSKISSVQSTIPTTDTKTLQTFHKAMDLHVDRETRPRWKRSSIDRALVYAKKHWADVWNQYLFWERFAETVKDSIAARASAGTGNISIDRIWFRRPSANAAASTAGSAWNLTERSMNWVLRIKWWPWVGVPVSRNTFKRHEWKVKPTSTSTP